MEIYISHSSSFDFKNELYYPIRNSELNNLHKITLPHEETTETFNSKEHIKRCHLVVAEVSFPSTGQGIELGWADSFGIPIVCIYRKGTKLSNSLKVVSSEFIDYDKPEDMIRKLSDYLKNFQNKL